MEIKYSITVKFLNMRSDTVVPFHKEFTEELSAIESRLYDNDHVLIERLYLLEVFKAEIDAYLNAISGTVNDIEIEEYEVVSLTDKVDVYFEAPEDEEVISLTPQLRAFVHPKNDGLPVPVLTGEVYDSRTIFWHIPDDGFSHYLIEEPLESYEPGDSRVIAELAIGKILYVETNLEPDTQYVRRIVSFTADQTSDPSRPVSLKTDTADVNLPVSRHAPLREYYFETDDSQKEIHERLDAFQSGIGDFNDLKVYKQMDSEFYEEFKAYLEVSGRRYQKENRYEQVGFNYKICLEAMERIEEQEGEVTFDIETYPREEISIMEYMWATKPVKIRIRIDADVDLYTNTGYMDQENTETQVPGPICLMEPGVNLLFIIDLSSSMNGKVGYIQKAMCDVVDMAVNFSKQSGMEAAKCSFSILGFAKVASDILYLGTIADADAIKAKINQPGGLVPSSFYGTNVGTLTNYVLALQSASNFSPPIPGARNAAIFFSDGGHCCFDGRPVNSEKPNWLSDHYEDEHRDKSFTDDIRRANLMGNPCPAHGTTPTKSAMTYFYENRKWPSIDGMQDIWFVLAPTDGYTADPWIFDVFRYPPYYIQDLAYAITTGMGAEGLSESNKTPLIAQNIGTMYVAFTSIFERYLEEGSGSTQTNTEYFDNELNMGEYETAHLTKYLEFTFDEGDPKNSKAGKGYNLIEYDFKEKRAVIKKTMTGIHASDTNLFDLLYPLIEDTPAYNRGYIYTRNHYNDNEERDGFIIKNLVISDNWVFSDEDDATTPLDELTWTPMQGSRTGTVDIWTDMDTLKTASKGDDRYICTTKNYLWIKGYVEALIFDGTRYMTTELNAYDHKTEILHAWKSTYEEYLFNRMNRSLAYAPKTGTIRYWLTFLKTGKDIFVTGIDKLTRPVTLFVEHELTGITHDVVAHNETFYTSPVLNYRFNLQDPEAKTPYYEILPGSDPKSQYPHIVILHVYYADNVYIWDENTFVKKYGTDPREFKGVSYLEYIRRDEWIDEWLWFYAEEMVKDVPYYDELPGSGMDTMYGLVNGRYRTDRLDGKYDLRVDTPQFNIPTTVTAVHASTIRIYIVIKESKPKDALVSYKWAHPWNAQDGITQVNGDYVTFSCDNVITKDIPYTDVLATYNMAQLALTDFKSREYIFDIDKPVSDKEYVNYFLKVETDNGDIIPLRYPTEIFFGNLNSTQVAVAFKGVVNATSKWSPRIHNGYYYINQHEHYAYSEFNVEANFDKHVETIFDEVDGYINVEVNLYREAKPPEQYSIVRQTRSELLQDEDKFTWVDGEGLTVAPIIDGLYYKKYATQEYLSPVLLFPNVLTEAKAINVDYHWSDGTTDIRMHVRSYDYQNGVWHDWVAFTNRTVPNAPLSNAYQIKVLMNPSVLNEEYSDHDYLCCFLDWQDQIDEANTTNIVTITDHMTTGPYINKGVFVSRTLNFACPSGLELDFYASTDKVSVQVAFSDNAEDMLIEHIQWKDYTTINLNSQYKFYRYRVEIPANEKLYYLHLTWKSLKSSSTLPYLTRISMTGTHAPSATTARFTNTESFKLTCDGTWRTAFGSLLTLIGADVTARGFSYSHIQSVKVLGTTDNIHIRTEKDISSQFPGEEVLDTQILAYTPERFINQVQSTPYIFVEEGMINIKGTPQQFAPITVEDENGNAFLEIKSPDFLQTESFKIKDNEFKYLELKTNAYDAGTLVIKADGEEMDREEYTLQNHLVIFKDFIKAEEMTAEYSIIRSFIAEIDRKAGTTAIKIYTGTDIPMPDKLKVFFETNERNNKFAASDLSLNPIYRSDYKGFIYLTEDSNDFYHIRIHCNPRRIYAGGQDTVDVSVECTDVLGNPVIAREVGLSCSNGVLLCEDYKTDMNGVIHAVYRSPALPGRDSIIARAQKDDLSPLQAVVTIISEER